ncbi:MAG: hypothetical protein F6K41_02040 [Symploca sp. SIO3E6]|nr:hypothetical protein [Caldora sp. SIO3E6]
MVRKLSKLALIALITIVVVAATAISTTPPIHPIPELPAQSNLGLNLARSMKLLAESNNQQSNTVRVLFYGQSITRDDWWKEVEADLKNRFPQADIITQNLAIGGFAAQRLVFNVERDILSFYPDLIIFHVYGDHFKYEEIIQKMRILTTADIAIQTDHFGAKTDPKKPDSDWSDFMNNDFLPEIAEKYQCELINVRSIWRQYLLDNNYQPSRLLRDDIHLNEHGNFLMSESVKNNLVANKDAKDTKTDRVKTYKVNQDVDYKDGKFTLEFVGNRVDAISSPSGEAKAKILIDGKPPSEIYELYVFTRANYTPEVDWPWDVSAPFHINWEKPPVEEDWKITILNVEQQESETLNFTFRLTGTKTGIDGVGSNQEVFISNSGRVVILPEHWWLKTVDGKPSPIKPGYELKFRSQLLGTDIYQKPEFRGFNRESTVTLAQGLKNEEHTLEIIPLESGKVPISSIRVYNPPLRKKQSL